MMKRADVLLLATAALLAASCQIDRTVSPLVTSAPAAADRVAAPAPGGATIADQYIVVFRPGVADAPGLARRLTAAAGGTLRFTYEHALSGFAAHLPAQAAEALRHNPNVDYVEPDQVMSAVTTQTGATWGIDRLDQRSGTNGSYTYAQTGAGVTAYIIDTGIYVSHPDFGGRARVGVDEVGGGHNGIDCNGHGTHVSGTVGGATFGVAKAVSLVAVRVLDCSGSGSTSGVVAGIDWVTADHATGAPAVANMSLGGGASSALDQAVRNSIADGVAYAIAAGNGNFAGRAQDACNYSPARVSEAMTIGATDNSDRKASWSNYGNCVDWFAPGVGITSDWLNNGTNTISGTSMATPHTTGVAALYLQAHPSATPAAVRDALYAATTKGIVTSSNTANNHLLYTDPAGWGGSSPPPNTPPTASFDYSCSGLTCSFTDTSTDPDGSISGRSWTFGDGSASTAANPQHSFAAGGDYTVSLTVTDNDGATGNTSRTVSVTASQPATITLSGVAGSQGPWSVAFLTWTTTSTAASFDVLRSGSVVATTSNNGQYNDKVGKHDTSSYTYQVCESGGGLCSNEITISF